MSAIAGEVVIATVSAAFGHKNQGGNNYASLPFCGPRP